MHGSITRGLDICSWTYRSMEAFIYLLGLSYLFKHTVHVHVCIQLFFLSYMYCIVFPVLRLFQSTINMFSYILQC